MARRPVDTRMETVLLQPQARPVDTFVQPARPAMADLADALAKLDRPLKGFLDGRAAKQAEEDRIRGEAAFYNDNDGEFAEAVRTGQIPAHYSPAFVKGYKNAQGNVAGNQLRSKFMRAWDEWEGKNSEDPAAFDDFMATFVQGQLGTDGARLNGALGAGLVETPN